jgi:hypothetical protein
LLIALLKPFKQRLAFQKGLAIVEPWKFGRQRAQYPL